MPSHVLDYQIHGDDLQFVEIGLDAGDTVIAEAGAMMFMEEGISMQTRMGDGSNPGAGVLDALFGMGKRFLTGESLFMTHYTADAGRHAKVSFGAPYPGRIVALDLAALGGTLLCQKQSFLCAALGTRLSIAFTKRFGAGLFGGEGFVLQKLQGDGLAFVHAGGMVLRRDLKPGEKLFVDTGCIVAFEDRVAYDIELVKGVGSMLFGGEGLFLATLQGPGAVWLQSLPFSRLADRVLASAPRHGGGSPEEGSILGGLGRMVGGR
jgi:uncharacterized protein (TIGR00266 family)